MSSIPLVFTLGFLLTISSSTILAINSSSEDSISLSSTTIDPQSVVSGSSSHSSKVVSSSPNQVVPMAQSNTWPAGSQSNPINYYQFAQSPSYNFRSPLSSSASSSFASLMSNILSPFNKVISRRAAGAKLFSLADQFNSNAANNLALEYSGSVGNLEALNEAVNNVMIGLNGLQPNQANQLAGQLGSYLSAAAGDGNNKNGKKLLDIPKQWYKILGEKLSGASEAAYSATVPLKESFMHTLKSFYSYIKPSRSQSISSFTDASGMVAATASAASSQESMLSGSNSIGGSNNQNNPKRRQSDSYGGYYYNNINNKLVPQASTAGSIASNQQPQQQQLVGARYHNRYHQHHQHHQPVHQHQHVHNYGGKPAVPLASQQHQPTRSTSAKMNQVQPVGGEMLAMESQVHPSISKQYSGNQHLSKQPRLTQTEQIVTNHGANSKSQYDQILNQMIQAQIQQGQQHLINPKHPNALYQKSKEIFSRFTKKRILQPQYGYNNQMPIMSDYVQTYQRLPTQTVAKVSNKLPSLPLIYNKQSPPSQQQQSQIQSNPNSNQQFQQSKAKNPQSYYTQQPMNQNPFGIQPVYPPPSQQQTSGTTSISSTSAPMSTSTSISMSIGSSYDNMENMEPQHIQYHSINGDHIKNYENNGNNISVANNQGSVMYYYDTQTMQQDPSNQQQHSQSKEQSSSSIVSDSEEPNQKKK